MRTFEKWTTRFLAGGIAAGILVTVSPFLGCFYRNHQFEKLIRLKIDVPDCQKSIPGGRSECCQCFLAFDGVRSADEIQFLGDRLKYSFDSERRIFLVAGGSVPIPVEKEKAYSPEKSVKEKARNLLTGGSGHRRNTPWRRLALLEKWAKRVPYERGWR